MPTGVQIKRLRTLAGVSQEELSEAVNMDRTVLSRLESDPQQLTHHKASELVRAIVALRSNRARDFDAVLMDAQCPAEQSDAEREGAVA